MNKKLTIISIASSLVTFLFLFVFLNDHAKAIKVPIKIFPLDNYSQNISDWIKPTDPDYNSQLIDKNKQQENLKEFYNHTYGDLSPWNSEYVTSKLKPDPDNHILEQKLIKFNLGSDNNISEQNIINNYGNLPETPEDRIGYAVNFRMHSDQWFKNIIDNMKLDQFRSVNYTPKNRAIIVKNALARALPTNTPHFNHIAFPGQGYPFDNLQESSIWVGTPVYIIGETLSQDWVLVLTPHLFTAWVESAAVATVSENFIKEWQAHALQGMVAITHTETNVIDTTTKRHRFKAYIGTVLPGKINQDSTIDALVPIVDELGNAQITNTTLNNSHATIMPLDATPHNFATIINNLLGRPYGWGGIYFYNDCSAELQSLYTPFGIWLPRNSSSQKNFGTVVDLSKSTLQERLKYLKDHGRKFTTMIYINGHVMLYIGNYHNPSSTNKPESMAMSFQNIWGLTPKNKTYRSIIGESVLFPILEQYPEDHNLASPADKPAFMLMYFDGLNDCTSDGKCAN